MSRPIVVWSHVTPMVVSESVRSERAWSLGSLTEKATQFKQTLVGPVQRDRAWFASTMVAGQCCAPQSEPGMPGMGEVAHHVVMSTVPNWETFC